MGRSRLVRDALRSLDPKARRVVRLAGASVPFGSLTPLAGSIDDEEDLAEQSLSAVTDVVEERLRARLAAGDIVVADPIHQVDSWSAQLLERNRDAGVIVRVLDAPPSNAEIQLTPLSSPDLQALFLGPDRLLHLREDAAQALYLRTRGLPAAVDVEVGAWVRAGLANWEGNRLRVTRRSLDSLRAGLRVAASGLEGHVTRPSLDREQEHLLSWVHLAGEQATPDLLRRVIGTSAWLLEGQLEELTRRGAVRRRDTGAFRPIVPAVSHQFWSADEIAKAHNVLAESLPVGDPARVLHRVLAGDSEQLTRDALLVADSLERRGERGKATSVLETAVASARQTGAVKVEAGLLEAWASIALLAPSRPLLERALHEWRRADLEVEGGKLNALLEAALATLSGEQTRGRSLLEGLSPFDNESLELCRVTWQVQSHRGAPLEEEAALLDRIAGWARDHSSADVRARFAGWRGLHLYRLGRFVEAAEAHLESAMGRADLIGRAASLINAASALLEGGQLERAREVAGRGLQLAEECRDATYEGRATWILRAIVYRSGELPLFDEELLDAAAQLGIPWLEGNLALVDAAAAWRRSQSAQPTASLAERAAQAFQKAQIGPGELLARALGSAAEGASNAELREHLHSSPTFVDVPAVGVQALGLYALRHGSTDQLKAVAASLLDLLSPDTASDRRLEVTSIAEALDALGLSVE